MGVSGVGLEDELVRRAIRRVAEAFQIGRLDVGARADGDEMNHNTVETPPRKRFGRVIDKELLVLPEEPQSLRDAVPLVQIVARRLDVEHPVNASHGRLHPAPEPHHVTVMIVGIVIGENDASCDAVALAALDHAEVADHGVGRMLAVSIHTADDARIGIDAPTIASDDIAGIAEVFRVVTNLEPRVRFAGRVEHIGGTIIRVVVDEQHAQLMAARREHEMHVGELLDERRNRTSHVVHGREDTNPHDLPFSPF